MRVNRTLLYTGIFLVAIGGVVVAADIGVVDETVLADALRLWPLAVIAVGLGLALRRTRVSLSGGMLAAAVPGLFLGSTLALVPRFSGFCGALDASTPAVTRQGTFQGPASVSVTTDCGSLVVATGAGSGWRLVARDSEGREPIVNAAARSLSIASVGDDWLGTGPDALDLALPTSGIQALTLVVNAGRGDVDLAEATLDRLSITANAAEVNVDASTSSVTSFTGEVNFGQLSIHLPGEVDVSGSLTVNAGHATICVPAGAGLRVFASGDASKVTVGGADQSGTVFQNAAYAAADHHVNLEVDVDFGAVEINPIGGCR